MAILACFVSNNPDKLELSLYAHSKNFDENTKVLIVDTNATHAANEKLASEFNATHVYEEAFKTTVKDEFKPLFQGKFGGNRNICLYHAFRQNANAVFSDDDTTPFGNPLEKYAQLFDEGKKIVVGKYLRHAGGSSQIILDIMNVLEDYSQTGNASASEQLESFFAGIPKETDSPVESMGMVGGNCGIHYDVLKKYCFFPTDYRVEDGIYGTMAEYCVNEKPFNAIANPAVFHTKAPSPNSFLPNLAGELKGGVIGLAIKDSLEEGRMMADSIEDRIPDYARKVFNAYALDVLKFKNEKFHLVAKAEELGFGEQFKQLSHFTPAAISPLPEELKRRVALFFYAQDKWPAALREGV